MPTIKEIAEKAGVSPSTVSNVINGRADKMKPETLEKVKAILKKEKYVSNMGGRLLAKNGSRLISLIMTYTREEEKNLIQDPFFSELIGALEREIRKHGYFMMLYTSASAEESLRMAASWNIEGMILQGCAPWDCETYMQNTSIPFVFIDAYHEEGGEKFINVGCRDYQGGVLMAKHLLEMGHRRIAFLADEQNPFGVDAQRLNGLIDTLRQNGIPCAKEDNHYAFSYRHAQRVTDLQQFAREEMHKYSALFFASDFYAVDAIHVFSDMGIRVPEDISVCGFDDNIFAVTCRPALTTIRQNVSEKAAVAIARLLQIIRNEPIPHLDTKLGVSLVARGSVKRCM